MKPTMQATDDTENADSIVVARLCQCIEDHAETLLKTLRDYVWRAGITQGESVQNTAIELLSEVVIEAFQSAHRFDPSRQPMAWLSGIAANLVKRKQKEMAKRAQREVLARDDVISELGTLSDDEVFERIASLTVGGPEQEVIDNEQANAILNLVSEEDQQVLRLAVIHELDGDALARELRVEPGTARVRLHRAIHRLRKAWHKRAEQQKGENDE